MRTPITRSVKLASIVAVLALAACEKEQTTAPTDGDTPVAEDAPGGTAAEPTEPEGGW